MMPSTYQFSDRVNKSLNSLPADMKSPIEEALIAEMTTGESPESVLTPVQMIVYLMIRDYARRDSRRAAV